MADQRHRFSGTLADEYDLITIAYPDFETFQRRMIETISTATVHEPRILEIGTGNGFTTRLLMEIPGAHIVTIDNDAQMVAQAREQLGDTVEIVEADAFEYLAAAQTGRFDVVASAFTLHNMEVSYREPVEREIWRVLTPGGLFTNADKYAPDGQERFDALVFQVERFFDAFVERGKLDLLRKWVTHNITDQSPRFVMTAADTPKRLHALGFTDVSVDDRSHMQAVLRAYKPREARGA